MRLQKEINHLKKSILTLGAMVEDQLKKVSTALLERDSDLALSIINGDKKIDDFEVEIEEDCLKVIALHQPVAADLRFIISCIKINNDLERIGDQIVNTAERIGKLSSWSNPTYVFDYKTMIDRTMEMLKLSLDSYVNLSHETATKVCMMDDKVDKIKYQVYDYIKEILQKTDQHIGYYLNMFLISRHIERIGDHATNIAEEVIYIVNGEIVRHNSL